MNKFSVFCVFTPVDGSCCTFVIVSFTTVDGSCCDSVLFTSNIGGLLDDIDFFPGSNKIFFCFRFVLFPTITPRFCIFPFTVDFSWDIVGFTTVESSCCTFIIFPSVTDGFCVFAPLFPNVDGNCDFVLFPSVTPEFCLFTTVECSWSGIVVLSITSDFSVILIFIFSKYFCKSFIFPLFIVWMKILSALLYCILFISFFFLNYLI